MPPRPLRFGLQVAPEPDDIARVGGEAEAAGFDVLTVADHIGPGSTSPLITLAALAAATSTIKLGTMVLNNDMRNPVQLAWEAASLHQLSGGRFELGLGAGHTPQEYRATGITLDRPRVRKQRLAESVEIIAALFAGESVDADGTHYRIEAAEVPTMSAPPPLLVGGNGEGLLTNAARHADAIGLQGLGRTKGDGHRHEVRWSTGHLEAQLATIATAAGDRRPELAALVQGVVITDDREKALDEFLDRAPSLSKADAATTPYLAIGTVEEIAAQFIEARDRWGISYFTVRSAELAPVIARVRQLEAGSG